MLSEKEKQEAESLTLDMRHLREGRHNPCVKNGKVDVDRYIDFLNEYNEFINHQPKPFKPIKDRIMKL
jgi:hypothetical protein